MAKSKKRKKEKNAVPTISELKFARVAMIILGVMFLILGCWLFIFLPVAAVCFYLSHVYKVELKQRQEALKQLQERHREINEEVAKMQREREAREAEKERHINFSFKVSGVTFKNGRKERQTILRAFKWGDEEVKSIDFEPYTYEGSPAVYVKFNDQVIGNVPAEDVEQFLEMERLHKREHISYDVYGGNKKEDGSRTNYGCAIYISYLKGEA